MHLYIQALYIPALWVTFVWRAKRKGAPTISEAPHRDKHPKTAVLEEAESDALHVLKPRLDLLKSMAAQILP